MKISVVIPAYNAERTIGRAIESVLAQTRPADEIIVIDDGSADATAGVVRQFADRVVLIEQTNAGVSVARNVGIQTATGDWIAFLDGDDEWLPGKLKVQTEYLQQHPQVKWAFANFHCKEPNFKSLQLAHVSPRLTQELTEGIFEDYFSAYVNHGYAWTGVVIIHRHLFEKVGMFEPGMKRAQDNDLWFRIAYQYPRVGYCSEPLAIYNLDTPDSSTKVNDTVEFMIDLVDRHETLAKQSNRYDAFCPCITKMLQGWMRQSLAQNRFCDIKTLLNKFAVYLDTRFKREMKFRLLCPPFTSWLADIILQFKSKAKKAPLRK